MSRVNWAWSLVAVAFICGVLFCSALVSTPSNNTPIAPAHQIPKIYAAATSLNAVGPDRLVQQTSPNGGVKIILGDGETQKPKPATTKTVQHEMLARLYTGDLSAAIIDSSNHNHAAEAVLFGMTEILKTAADSDRNQTEQDLNKNLKHIANLAKQQAAGEKIHCELDGEIRVVNNKQGSMEIELNNCNINGEGLSGKVALQAQNEQSTDGEFAATYEIENSSYGSGAMECFAFDSTCYSSKDYSIGTKHIRLEEAAVTGNAKQGFTMGSRVYSDTLGYVDTLAIDMIPCHGGGFSSGLIGIADATSETVMTIEYTDCNQYKLTYHGA